MRVISGFFVMMGLVLVLSVGAAGQVCGDIDGDGHIDLSEMMLLYEYGSGRVWPGNNYGLAEFDGRTNVSFSDLSILMDHLVGSFEPLVCNPVTLEYTFAPSDAETVYVPRILSIPENVQRIGLPLYSVCSDSVGGICLPLLLTGPGSTANFQYDEETDLPGGIISDPVSVDESWDKDTVMVYTFPRYHNTLKGRVEWGVYWYNRTAPGPGAIVPQPFDRHPMWRTSVAKEGDLHVPVIVYYDYVIPPDTMVVTPTTTSLTTYAHRLSKDSVAITYTSSPNPVDFTLNASESWVVYPTGTLTTPVTVYLRANADSLTAGSYAATLNVNTVDPAITIAPGPLTLNLTVLPPIDFPIGDFDCSGNIDINDLTILIIHMFLGGPAPEPCY